MSGEERTPNRTDNRTFVITFSIVISEEFVNNIIADKKSARPTEITIQFRLKQESGQLSDGSLKVRSFFWLGIIFYPRGQGVGTTLEWYLYLAASRGDRNHMLVCLNKSIVCISQNIFQL